MCTKLKPLAVAAVFFAGMITAHSQTKKIVADKIVATVGDRIILQSDIKNSLENARSEGIDVNDDAGCLLMEQALASKVLLLQAMKDSLQITDEEVEAELDQKIRYYIKILRSKEALEDYAGKTIYQIKDDARESVKENMLVAAMQQKIISSVKVTPAEVTAFFNRIPTDSLPFIESKFEVGQIIAKPEASRDMEQYTIAELNNYKKQIANKVASFEQLASLYSEHQESKKDGGNYHLNRNDKNWDPGFLSALFRLKKGEISDIIRSGKSEYCLVQMINRQGDDADIRLILRTSPITGKEITQSRERLDTIRSKIIAGLISFNEAALKYNDDPIEKSTGPFLLNQDGSSHITIQQMDKEMVALLGKMKVGEISAPAPITIGHDKKAVRIVYLKSRTEPHRLNLKDDYADISFAALQKKKEQTLNNWLRSRMPDYSIMIDESAKAECPTLHEYASFAIDY